MKSLFKIFDSPTMMTLFSLASKSLSFVIITPFLLVNFTSEEIALWYLLGVFINLQALADFGFYNTFVRAIALALSGGCSSVHDLNKIEDKNRTVGRPNEELAGQVIGTMRRVYRILTVILLIALISCSPLLSKNIQETGNITEGWICWAVVILFSIINFLGRPYSNFLLAQNKVALVRKWEGIFNMIALIVNIIVVLTVDSLLLLVISNQIWIFVNLLRNRYLARTLEQGYKYQTFSQFEYDKNVMKIVWPLAWKAGLSSLTTQGVVSASGLIYAQFCPATAASSYLFAEKLFTSMRSFAQAPFYSKVPLLVTLRGQEKIQEWERVAQKGMFWATCIFVTGIIFCDILGETFFGLIKSNVQFPNHKLWLLMGWAYVLHRYGAMHTQLYTTINKVNSHISDIVSGVIMITVWVLLVDRLDVYVFPTGMLCGYLFFYIWFAGYFSYKVIESHPIKFEFRANMIPLSCLLIYTIIRIYMI